MHEHENVQFDDIAKILQQAHLRRSADIGMWLRQYLQESRQVKAQTATSPAPVLGRIAPALAPIRRQTA
jgi:hypothetical protein